MSIKPSRAWATGFAQAHILGRPPRHRRRRLAARALPEVRATAGTVYPCMPDPVDRRRYARSSMGSKRTTCLTPERRIMPRMRRLKDGQKHSENETTSPLTSALIRLPRLWPVQTRAHGPWDWDRLWRPPAPGGAGSPAQQPHRAPSGPPPEPCGLLWPPRTPLVRSLSWLGGPHRWLHSVTSHATKPNVRF